MFQIAPHVIPCPFALSFTLVTYITNPKEEIRTFLPSDFLKLDSIFEMLITIEKIKNVEVPHN
jgi:hypothetical protein